MAAWVVTWMGPTLKSHHPQHLGRRAGRQYPEPVTNHNAHASGWQTR
ncbi:hypothetical protein HMPREF9595_02374 [Cutibacterium acnes HL005PA2]|nr:hypothetical protein HMPREF9595_02374 [Cutibacterium acnes HL005PA2]